MTDTSSSIASSDSFEFYRLSPQQRWAWNSQRDGNPCRTQCFVGIHDNVRIDALEEALRRIAERHEILRTRFPRVQGMKIPVQMIVDSLPSLRVADVSELSGTERNVIIGDKLLMERNYPIDVEAGSPVQALLLKTDPEPNVLVLTLPTLCADSRSLQLIVRDLNRYYAGVEAAEDEPVQYVQFSEWQNEILESDDEYREAGISYWRKATVDLPETPALPFEAKSGDKQPVPSVVYGARLEGETLSQLRKWRDDEDVPLTGILAACWHVVLGTFAGQPDMPLWVGVDGRKFPDLYEAIGLFASYVPIRANFDASEGFREIIRRMNGVIQDAAAVQEYYWADQSGSTAVSAMEAGFGFSYEDVRPQEDFGDQSLVAGAGTYCDLNPFKLALRCEEGMSMEGADCISLEFAYDFRRFQHADILRLADSFSILLEHALNRPDAPIASLPLLPPQERERVLNGWNQTQREFPPVEAVHHLFERHAGAYPDALALVCENEQLTYRQLNARANQLAHLLQDRGVQPGAIVGLCLPRTADLIVGLLGILKAGAAYLPLDATLPNERLRGMVEDSGARLLVSHSSAVALDAESVLLNRDASEIAGCSEENPQSGVRSEHLVYVIYTSGSTGRPKGVMITHANLLNYVQGMGERLGLAEGAGYATVSTIAADLGHTTLYGALCLGGCLHLLGSDRVMDPQGWREYFRSNRIDCLKIVPSHLSALLGSGSEGEEMLPCSVLVLGGEACSWELVERVRAASPSLRILNHYGPTETTVGVLTYEVTEGLDASTVGSLTVPLGRPLPNSRVYVLNGFLEPVPVGVVGEIYIGGAGVGSGYLNRPELTPERFIVNPYSDAPRARLYRTGDQGRYLEDGSIEFVGRVDHQVKIRGYRIELGEIENVLLAHPEVREAVVLARADGLGEKRLVAYVVGRDEELNREEALNGAALREHLRLKLPEYMVPGWVVVLPRLPLTSNGKVDRSVLPSPEELESVGEVAGARDAVESVLVGIWEELLGREGVGVYQSFFEVGGHSLLATQVISRVRETFQVDVPLRALFESPTIAALAEYVQTLQRAGEGLLLPPLTPTSRDKDLPLSFSQQRLWFIDQLQPGSYLYNVPAALRIRGNLDIGALQHALQEIFTRHEILRTRYAVTDGQPVQIISQDTHFPLPVRDLSDLPQARCEDQVRRLCREEATRPFDLGCDPMMRAQVLRLGQQEHLLLLTLHHIASDGWSKSILARELSRLYNAFVSNAPLPLLPLPIQYADYAAWQRGWLSGDVLQRQVDYWASRLAGSPPVLELPTDRPREAATSYEGAMHEFVVPSELSESLRRVCREGRATPFMVLLSAFNVLLYRWTGQSDLVVGTDVANRTQPQTEGLIGFFLNHLVLRTQLAGDPSFRDVLAQVREGCLEAYAHQDLPFDKLVEVLQPERRLSHTPVFQVLFVVHNVPGGATELTGLTLEGAGSEFGASKFDLSLFMGESAGGLAGAWVYRTDLFDEGSIRRLSQEFLGVLGQVLQHPDMTIEDVELVSEVERLTEQDTERSGAPGVREARRRTAAVPSGVNEV